MTAATVQLPNAPAAAASIAAWAKTDAGLAALLTQGTPAKAAAVWGQRLLNQNRVGDAVTAFLAAAALAPEDALLWTNLGLALDRAEEPARAEACLHRAVELAPNQGDNWLLLSSVQKKQGDLSGAEASCRKALDIDRQQALTWQCLGLIKQEQRDYDAAIDCFLKCDQYGGSSGATLANLGRLYYLIGRVDAAWASYARAVQLEPANPHFQLMLRQTRFMQDMIAGAQVDDALGAYDRLRKLSEAATGGTPGDAESERRKLFERAMGMLSGYGHSDAAARVGLKHQQLWPSVTADYLLSAITGDQSLMRSPSDFIATHFDAFAQGFDEQLVGVLGYDIPEKLVAAVAQFIPAGAIGRTLDMGCGTGLCGPLLRPLSRSLTGVDLSPKMLEQAKARNAYDTLECDDLLHYLEGALEPFDLMVAADVLIYFGDLTPVFAAAARALRPGGLLGVSTETTRGKKFKLLPSGRFAHGREYVRAAAKAAFTECAAIETTIRLEAGKRVGGYIFVFKRN